MQKNEMKSQVKIYNMEDFDPTPYIQYYEDGTAYLKFMTQIMWFRQVYPKGKIAAFKPVWCEERTPGQYVCTARVYEDKNDPMDNFIAEASCMRGAIVVDGTEVSGYTMAHRAAISEALKLAGFWVPLSEADYTAEPTANGEEGLADKSDADAAIATEATTTPKGKKRGRKSNAEKAAEAQVTETVTTPTEETTTIPAEEIVAEDTEETATTDLVEETTTASVEETVAENTEETATADSVEETATTPAEEATAEDTVETATADSVEEVIEEAPAHEYTEEQLTEALAHVVNHRGYNNTMAALLEEAKTENDKRSYLNWFAFSPLALRTMPETANAAKVVLDYNKDLIQNLY